MKPMGPAKLVELAGKELSLPRWLSSALGVSAFAILIALSSRVHVRMFFTPVPVTLQTFFVVLAGMILGRRLGPFAVVAVVAAGLGGLPVFAGPVVKTGGYIAGFLAGAYVAGLLAGERPGFLRALGAAAAGSVVILVMGTLWLGAWMAWMGLEPQGAVVLGLLPFVPGDALKAVLAAATVSARSRLKKKKACTTS